MTMHLFNIFYLLVYQGLCYGFSLEILHSNMIIFGIVCSELRGSFWSIVSLLESIVLLGSRNKIIGVAMNARIHIRQHLFLIFLCWIRNQSLWHMRLVLPSTWITIWKLQMVKLRNIWHSFSSSTIDLSTSRTIESLLNSLVLTSTPSTDIIIHPQLLLSRNLTLNGLYLLISCLLRLHRYYTCLFQLALFNRAYHLVAAVCTHRTLHMVTIYILGHCFLILLFLLLTLLLPGFKHMYLILLYFLYVLNLLLL